MFGFTWDIDVNCIRYIESAYVNSTLLTFCLVCSITVDHVGGFIVVPAVIKRSNFPPPSKWTVSFPNSIPKLHSKTPFPNSIPFNTIPDYFSSGAIPQIAFHLEPFPRLQNLGLRLFVVDVDHTVYVVVLGIEIEHCSIAYFNCLILKGSCALYRGVRYICMYVARMSPTLNRNFALLCFKCDNVIEQNNVGLLPRTATYVYILVAVPCRTQWLFRYVFQSHCCLWDAVSLKLLLRAGFICTL